MFFPLAIIAMLFLNLVDMFCLLFRRAKTTNISIYLDVTLDELHVMREICVVYRQSKIFLMRRAGSDHEHKFSHRLHCLRQVKVDRTFTFLDPHGNLHFVLDFNVITHFGQGI